MTCLFNNWNLKLALGLHPSQFLENLTDSSHSSGQANKEALSSSIHQANSTIFF